jgi:hypothetical protein
LGRAAGAAVRGRPAYHAVLVTATGRWVYRWSYQFFSSEALDEAYVPFFGAFGTAWDDAIVARWSANPLGMLSPEMDAALLGGEYGGRGPSAAVQRPLIIIAAQSKHSGQGAKRNSWFSSHVARQCTSPYRPPNLDHLDQLQDSRGPHLLQRVACHSQRRHPGHPADAIWEMVDTAPRFTRSL